MAGIALVFISSGLLPVYAAGFDCNKAVTYVELTVCTNPELSKLDDQLSILYKDSLIKHPQSVQMIKKSQLAWLKEQRNKSANAEEIKTVYLSRISDLKLMMDVRSEDEKLKAEASKLTESPKEPVVQPQKEIEVQKPVDTPQQKADYVAYSDRLTETFNEYTRRPGSAVYYCYTYDQNMKNRSAYDGLFLNASNNNLITSEAIDYAEQLHKLIGEFDPNAPQELKTLMKGFTETLSDNCNKLADLAYRKGWAL